MLPGAYDLNLYQGDTSRLQFVLWQDAAKTLPVDLVGATAKAQIRDRPGSNTVVVELVCTIGPPNTVQVVVPAGAAQALNAKGAWDLQLTWPNGDIQTVVAGSVFVTADVTRNNA